MLAQIESVGLQRVESYRVRVEVNLTRGLPTFTVVGLAAGAVREGRDRVRAALKNAGFSAPPKRITVNLAPADVPKGGSAFDLPIAVGLLVGEGHVEPEAVADTAFVGELGLDGSLRPVTPSFGGDQLLTTNLTGHPAVVVPGGFQADGTPAGITFVGRLWRETELLAVAKAYQDETGFHKRRPPAFG